MPVCVDNYTWTQTESTVRVHVPCKSRKVHIVSTDEYLKAHFPPFLFEAFLFEAVDDSKSKAEIGNGAVVFTLQKRTSRMWEHLMVQTKGTEEMRKLRERALQEFQQKVCEESRQKAEKRREYKEFALQTMMGLEWTERDTIQKNKDAEREKTTAELEAWQQRQKALEKEEILNGLQRRPEVPRKKLPCPLGRKPGVNPNTEETKVIKELPQRPPGNIRFTFTPRAFPTALRESRMAEEEEYLRQQAEARGAADADIQELTDLTAEERNPEWLKDKGDKCFKVGDYMGALNAYSLAIKINKKIPALFSNRAACHLKLNHLPKAVKDASQALVLLTLTDAENTTARLRPTVRRGTAFCLLQRYERGLQDYEAALEIDPHNQALQADTQRIRDIIQNSSSKLLQ